MSATLAQLVQRVKTRLKDPEFDDDELKQFVNDTQNEVVGSTPFMFLENLHNSTGVVASGELELPVDYQVTRRITVAKDNIGRVLDYIDPRTYLERSAEHLHSLDYKYTVFGGKILYNLPHKAGEENNEIYDVYHAYLSKPVQMVAGSNTAVIPEEFSEILVLGALARAEATRDNYDFSAIHSAHYDQLVENMNLRYGPRQFDGGNVSMLPYGQKITVYG